MTYQKDPRVDSYIDALPGGQDTQTARTVAVRQDKKINTKVLGEMFRQIIADNRAGGRRKIKQAQ